MKRLLLLIFFLTSVMAFSEVKANSFIPLSPSETPSQIPLSESGPASRPEISQTIINALSEQYLPAQSQPITLLRNDEYFFALRRHLQQAKRSIEIIMYLFKITSSPQNRPLILINDLIEARKRGVSIQVVLEKSNFNDELNAENKKVEMVLRKNNIDIRFDSPVRTTHGKVVIIDRQFLFIGSHNFTHSALSKNNELSLLLDNKKLCGEISALFGTL